MLRYFKKFKNYLDDKKWDIIYAWQRATRGYDEREVFDYFSCFLTNNRKLLEEFAKNCDCFPCPCSYTTSNKDKYKKEWEEKLSRLVVCFQEADEETSSITDKTEFSEEEKFMYRKHQFETAMKLLTENFWDLWF